MNIKEYISSGILESYVLGSCTAAEQREVEAYTLQYFEVQEELEAIREALSDYALLHEQTPPPHLKEKIAAAIKHGSTSLTMTQEIRKEAKIIPLKKEETQSGNANVYKFLAAASVALLIASGWMNYNFYSHLQDTKNELAELRSEKDVLANDMKVQQANYALVQKKMELWHHDMDMVKQPNMVAMPMKGKDVAPDAKVCVYGDSKTNEIFLEVNKLPKAPAGMQYQLWAIVKGKPVSAGMIQLCEQPDTCGIMKMNTIADAHAFAISLEKEGGNPAPQGNIFATFGI